MAQSVQEQQRNAILRMLNLSESGEQSWGSGQTWKVLIFDKFCQDVVAPLLKIGGLRNHGVTLHLGLNSERLPVADVPAVYFVEPTTQNIAKICEDLNKGLYVSCYINFASAVPRSLLVDLAQGAMQARAAQRVAGVFDRYVSFVSLAPGLFSLNLPAAYETIHSPLADDQIQQYIERIVDGMLSVLITLRALPVIRCPPGYAAEMVGRRLEERIRELLNKGGSAAAELFSNAAVGASRVANSGAAQRPVLCILDRDVDLVTMLHHTWTYQAMVHDVLGMKLNKLNVPVASNEDPSAPPKVQQYDVDESDNFWVAHAGEPWPDVASAVHEAIEEYSKKCKEMTGSSDASDSLAPGLAAAINAMPEMTEKKRSIDMHTNIVTALLNEVKARELATYYEMEDNFATNSLSTSISDLEKLLQDGGRGTLLDKTRALMVLYLTKQSITSTQLQGLMDALSAAGGDPSGIFHLKHMATIRNMTVPSMAVPGLPAAAPANSSGASWMIGSLADKMRSTGEGLLQSGLQNIKNIVNTKKELLICQILDGVMDQKGTGVTENYIYLDPKAPPTGGEPPRMKAPFRRAIAFVVGGGNYTEMQSLQEWAQSQGRQVTYGATDMVSPLQFVDELCNLGKEQVPGGGAGDLR